MKNSWKWPTTGRKSRFVAGYWMASRLRDGVNLRPGVLDRGAIGQAADDAPGVAVAPIQNPRGFHQRDPHRHFWGNEKPCGMTPMMVIGAPFFLTMRPMTAGSLPYRRSQKP